MSDAFDRHIGNFSPYYIPSTRYIAYAPLDRVSGRSYVPEGFPFLPIPMDIPWRKRRSSS